MVRAAFFDLDKTILDTSSNVALSGPFIEAGLMNRRTALTSVLVQLPYLLAGADESRMEQMAQALGRMGRGWNAAFLEATVEDALERTIQPVCYAQALARIEAHKRAGDVVVIASASVEQVVRPIAQMLGADEVLASRATVDDDGCFTGEITHFNQAQGKADACEALARARGWVLSTRTAPCARWRSARAGQPSPSRPRCASYRARFPRPRRSRYLSSPASPWARRPACCCAAEKQP